MKKFNELQLSKDLISFPSVTPIDAGAINYISKKLIAPASFGVILGILIRSLANFNSLILAISLLINH